MRLSAKGKYALAAMEVLARRHSSGTPVTILSIAEQLGISKIYLEQVFSLLKRSGLVSSIKGSQGGYQLTRMPQSITAYDVLSSIELGLTEETQAATGGGVPVLDEALRDTVFTPLDEAIKKVLSSITLEVIITATEKHLKDEQLMYYI